MAVPAFHELPDPAEELPAVGEVLNADEAQAYLRLGPKKFEEVSPRLPGTTLGHRTTVYSRRLLLEWVEANAEISDPRQQAYRRQMGVAR